MSPEGRLIVVDADWVDSLDSRRPRKNDDGVRTRGGESGFGGTDVIDPVFRRLPLTGASRPAWDIHELESLGMEVTDIMPFQDTLVEDTIHDVVGDSFIVVARKH